MDEALQASKGDRTASRLGYRAGYYNRMLVTRVGHRSALDSAGTAASSVAAATVLLDRQRAHANRTDQLQLVVPLFRRPRNGRASMESGCVLKESRPVAQR